MSAEHQIGTLSEKSLHASLKNWYAKPGDKIEEKVGNYHIDILRGKHIIEIQTRSLAALKKKTAALADDYTIQIIHPIAKEKWIVRATKKGKEKSRRKSPKQGRIEDVFNELVNAPNLIQHKNVSLKVVFIQMEEIWVDDGKGSWRRKRWSIGDRRLVKVLDEVEFKSPSDFLSLLPKSLPKQFTNKQLAEQLNTPIRTVQKMTYAMRKMGILEVVGKEGRAYLLETSR